MSIKSLIINPGSTSTKIGVFEDETLLFEETLRHSTEEIRCYEFHCQAPDSTEILVYINPSTLEEEDILILLKSDGGTLVK